jgi:hypothetical protein
VIGALVMAAAGRPAALAGCCGWISGSPAKDDARLPAMADTSDAAAVSAGCLALMLDRFSGVTAAVACSAAPQLPAAVVPLEIES